MIVSAVAVHEAIMRNEDLLPLLLLFPPVNACCKIEIKLKGPVSDKADFKFIKSFAASSGDCLAWEAALQLTTSSTKGRTMFSLKYSTKLGTRSMEQKSSQMRFISGIK